MAYTTQQLADLRAAIAEGVLKVSGPNGMTEFRSLEEMLRLERTIAAEVEPSVTALRPRRMYYSFERA